MYEAAAALCMENPEDDCYQIMKDWVNEDETFWVIVGEWVSNSHFNVTMLTIMFLQGCRSHPSCTHFHAFSCHHLNYILLLWQWCPHLQAYLSTSQCNLFMYPGQWVTNNQGTIGPTLLSCHIDCWCPARFPGLPSEMKPTSPQLPSWWSARHGSTFWPLLAPGFHLTTHWACLLNQTSWSFWFQWLLWQLL